MSISTFQERQKLEYIYNTYFDPDSEHCLDFNLFDTLEYQGIITEENSEKLCRDFQIMGEKLWQEMQAFDKLNMKKHGNNGK